MSAGLLVIFIVAVISAAARGLSIDCGCFGGGGEVAAGQTAYGVEIARDLGFLMLALWLVWHPRSRFALGRTGPRKPTSRRCRMAGPDRQQRILIIAVVAFFVLVVGGGIGLQAWRTQRAPSAVPSPAATTAPITVADGMPLVLGSADAPVKIALYEDFHCPHCAEFEEEFGTR